MSSPLVIHTRLRTAHRAIERCTRTASLILVLVAAPGGAGGAEADSRAEGLAVLLAQMDQHWEGRANSGAIQAIVSLGAIAYAVDPTRVDACWRLARAYWWVARTQPNRSAKKALAAKANEWAERTIRMAPERAEGYYYSALAIGEYAATIGFIEAVRQGVGGRVERAALQAYARERDFDSGGPMIVLGRFYFVLPWPLRDLKQSRRYLEEIRTRQPTTLIGRYYLAETYRELGEPEKARGELDYILSSPARVDDQEAATLARDALKQWFGTS